MECYDGINIPDKITEPCKGIYTSNACIVHEQAIVALGLAANTTMDEVVISLVQALVQKENQIQSLIDRVEALENA